jgi:hypothetical protein
MSEENIQKMKKLNREELEELTTWLWNELNKKEFEEMFVQKESNNRYIKHLESENERLTKAVSGIYQDIKLKMLKFFINAKPTYEQRDIITSLFKNYLK